MALENQNVPFRGNEQQADLFNSELVYTDIFKWKYY